MGGFPIFHEAYENIVQRRMTMELSMPIAIVAALAIREIFRALVITLFVLIAEILEGLTVSRGRAAIERQSQRIVRQTGLSRRQSRPCRPSKCRGGSQRRRDRILCVVPPVMLYQHLRARG